MCDTNCKNKNSNPWRKVKPVETFEDAMSALFARDSHDAVARDMGYADAAQMFYYENLADTEQSRQDALLHELSKVDPREVYSNDGE